MSRVCLTIGRDCTLFLIAAGTMRCLAKRLDGSCTKALQSIPCIEAELGQLHSAFLSDVPPPGSQDPQAPYVLKHPAIENPRSLKLTSRCDTVSDAHA